MFFLGACDCCGCPTNSCTDSCSCASLTIPQPAIKVFDLGCEEWCTGGTLLSWDGSSQVLPGGSLTESIAYYSSTNPTLINGCCYTVWNLQSQLRLNAEGNNPQYPGSVFATKQFCYNQSDFEGPLGPITVTLRCCPGVPKYTINYLYRNKASNYTAGMTADTQNLCVVNGILKGSVIVNVGAEWGFGRPDCQLCLVFGEQ